MHMRIGNLWMSYGKHPTFGAATGCEHIRNRGGEWKTSAFSNSQ